MNYPWKTICQSCKGKIVSSDGTIVDTVFEMPRLHCSVRIVSVNSHNVGLKMVISFAASILTDKTSTQVERNAYYLYQMVDFNRKYSFLDSFHVSGTLDCRELQTALSYGGLHFSLPTVNILLSKHDRNRKWMVRSGCNIVDSWNLRSSRRFWMRCGGGRCIHLRWLIHRMPLTILIWIRADPSTFRNSNRRWL